MSLRALPLLVLVAIVPPLPAFAQDSPAGNWPRFRGPGGTGVAAEAKVPLTWSAEENIVWRAELPGRGASSPVVWGENVYVTAYTGYGLSEQSPGERAELERHLLCFNRRDGSLRWRAAHGGENREHSIVNFLALHGYASSTPAADASGVYVYYGAGGVVAYSHAGEKRWERSLGHESHNFGSASSPVIHEDLLIVHADIESQTLAALDKARGAEVWRIETGSQDAGDSWSTPLLVEAAGGPELVFHRSQGDPATLAAVEPRNGKPLWECGVLKDYLCPSPVAAGGVIYAFGYKRGAAVRAGGRGDVSASHVEWQINSGSEVCTPLVHEGHLYWTSPEGGIAYCLEAASGRFVYQERLRPEAGRIYASGVLAGGAIYYVSRAAGTYAVAARPEFKQLAHNVIATDPSVFNGTPAISGNRMFLRSDGALYCIGTK